MPKVLNITTQNTYSDANTIQNVYGSKGGWISNSGTVFCQVQRSNESAQGTDTWSEEFPLPSGSHFLAEGTIGIRVRSFTSGLSVSVTAVVWWPYEPNMILGSSGFAQSVATVITQQIFINTSGPPTTYTLPNGCVAIIVECIGGGGAGGGTQATGAAQGSAGGGGAGGCYAKKLIIAPNPTYAFSVGAGGVGQNGGAGLAGSQTSFGSPNVVLGPGGNGGGLGGTTGTFPGVGAIGGAGTGAQIGIGDIIAFGAPGEQSLVLGSGTNGATSGMGGIAAGPYGGSGGFVVFSNGVVAGTAGNLIGGGGSGAASSASSAAGTGGNGARGIIVVTEFY